MPIYRYHCAHCEWRGWIGLVELGVRRMRTVGIHAGQVFGIHAFSARIDLLLAVEERSDPVARLATLFRMSE